MLKALLYRLRDSHYMAAVQRVAGPGGAEVVVLQEAPLEVQSLIFSKEKWTKAEDCQAWARDHDFKADKVDETDESFRLRQFEPSECRTGSMRTIDIDEEQKIKAVGCRKKEADAPDEDPKSQRPVRNAFGLVREVTEDGTVYGYASLRSVDRYKEMVKPAAFEKWLPVFLKHPVMLLGHENDASVELPVGDWHQVEIDNDGLKTEGKLLREHRRYEEVRAAAKRGLLALSIGFIPKAGHEPTDEEVKEMGKELRFVWDEVELLEVSLVSIPANRDTLAAMKQMAHDMARRDIDAAEWALLVRELKGLNDQVGKVRQASKRRNWGPAVEALEVAANEFAHKFSTAIDALRKYLEENVGPAEGEPEEEPPAEPPVEGESEDVAADDWTALRELRDRTNGLVVNAGAPNHKED